MLDDRLLSNLKGELDSVNVLRNIWWDQLGGSPERLIEFYERTNDENGTLHYENLIDSILMTYAAEFIVLLLSGVAVVEYTLNRDKILDKIRRLYRVPPHQILEATDKITSKYDKSIRYLFRVYALKEYSEKKQLPLGKFISLREDIRTNIYSNEEKPLPKDFLHFYNSYLEHHMLPNLEKTYAQNLGLEFVTLSLETNFNNYVRAMAGEKIQGANRDSFPTVRKILQGISAGRRGTATGKVAIVLDEEDCEKVQEGDVMIVDEMCPEFVPAAKRAVALISNRGGITSHTAVIGRALDKPTIVGTVKATEVLKNGLEIMVDSNRGIVFTLIKDA